VFIWTDFVVRCRILSSKGCDLIFLNDVRIILFFSIENQLLNGIILKRFCQQVEFCH